MARSTCPSRTGTTFGGEPAGRRPALPEPVAVAPGAAAGRDRGDPAGAWRAATADGEEDCAEDEAGDPDGPGLDGAGPRSPA
ncbi:hypothetical protein I6A94_34250, partial [Frankia sp. CN4]|nr:hypothetical protein [Frankia nepalensis]